MRCRAALREQRRRRLEERLAAGSRWQDRGVVFTTTNGTPYDAANLRRAFQAALRRAGLPPQRWHDLHHATATLLLEAGEELGVVSKMLGHANLSTTADTYAHWTPAMSHRVAARNPAAEGDDGMSKGQVQRLEPRWRLEELQEELWGVVEAMQAGRMMPAEANAITREAGREIRAFDAALRLSRQGMRLGSTAGRSRG